jgi:hypothetical protein
VRLNNNVGIIAFMRIASKRVKIAFAILALFTLVVGICATQFYVVELESPAYEGHPLGLRPSRSGDLALVSKHFAIGSLRAGDLALLELQHANGPEHLVRVIDQPPNASTGQFTWIEYFPNSISNPTQTEGPCTNGVIRGRVVCMIRIPWTWFQ